MTTKSTQDLEKQFYQLAISGTIPPQTGDPLTEEEVLKYTLDGLEREFFSRAIVGQLPSTLPLNPFVLTFGGASGATRSGFNFGTRYNSTSGTRGADGWSFDLLIPVGVEDRIILIGDEAGNGAPISIQTVGGLTRILASSTIETGRNLADGQWHHFDFFKSSNTFNYSVAVDGDYLTASTSSSTNRFVDSFGLGLASISSPYGGVQARNVYAVYNSSTVAGYLLDEGTGTSVNNLYGATSLLEGDTSWIESPAPVYAEGNLGFVDANDYNLVRTQDDMFILGATGVDDRLEFEYKADVLDSSNVILSRAGFQTGSENSTMYVQNTSPTILRFVNDSGITRTLDTTVNLGDGQWHKIVLRGTGSTSMSVEVDGVVRGSFTGMNLAALTSFGGRAGALLSRAQGWGVRNIINVYNDVVVIDAKGNEGVGRILRNEGTGDDLVISALTYPWEFAPTLI